MRAMSGLSSLALVFVALSFTGCSKATAPAPSQTPANTAEHADATEPDDEVAKAIAELPEAERPIALAQKYCPVSAMNGGSSQLGSMGMPVKVTLDGKDVYLCCDGCKEEAEKDPAATLAKVEELKTRAIEETK
jgi:hypothetical protein